MSAATRRLVMVSLFAVVYAFLLLPVIITIAISFNPASLVTLFYTGFSLTWYYQFLVSPAWTGPFLTSIYLAILASVISIVLGLITAYALVRYNLRGKHLLESLFLTPLVIPGIIVGIALLLFFSYLGSHNYFMNLLAAHTVLVLPFSILAITSSLELFDRNIELAAQSLGADPLRTFLGITVPNISAGVFAAAVLSFIISFGESNASLFLVGPNTVTLPVAVFLSLQWGSTPIIAAVSTVQIAVILVLMWALNKTGQGRTALRF